MTTVNQMLKRKGHSVWSAALNASVYEALETMAEKHVGALVVLRDGKLAGIFSERDYARKIILKEKSSKDTRVHEIMTQKVYYVKLDQTVEDCMALMTEKRIRHLPVVDDDQVVGLISIGDVVKSIISEQKFMIEQLEQYISGR
ncbi:MAG: CBS domain-containing protein [Myxococcales bacterium]|nr:CBS domain-containing protein [Myxococcales bacterium]